MNPLESNSEPLRLSSHRSLNSSSSPHYPSSPFRISSVSERRPSGAVTISTWMHIVLISAHGLYGFTNGAWNPLLGIWLFMEEKFSLAWIGFAFGISRSLHSLASPLMFSAITRAASFPVALAASFFIAGTFRIAMLAWKESPFLVSLCMVISTCFFALSKQLLDQYTTDIVQHSRLQTRYSIYGGSGWILGGASVCLVIAKTDVFWPAFVWGGISCIILTLLWIVLVPMCEYCIGSPQRMSSIHLREVYGLPRVTFSSGTFVGISNDAESDTDELMSPHFGSKWALCCSQFSVYQFRILFSFVCIGYSLGLTSTFNFIILYRHHIYFKHFSGYFNGTIFVFFALLLFIQFASEMVGFVTFSWVSGKVGTRGCLVTCFVLIGLRLLVYGASGDHSWVRESLATWGSYLALIGSVEVFHGISFAYAWCLTGQFSNSVASPYVKSIFQAVSKSALIGFGMALGSLCGAAMSNGQGLSAGYILSASFFGVLSVLEILCPLCAFRNESLLDLSVGEEEEDSADEYGYHYYYNGMSPAVRADV